MSIFKIGPSGNGNGGIVPPWLLMIPDPNAPTLPVVPDPDQVIILSAGQVAPCRAKCLTEAAHRD